MASLTNNLRRNVVPNWRDYKTTAAIGELSGNNVDTTTSITLFPINEYIKSWKENQTIPYAGDLISAAIMNDQKDNISVIQAAKFIVERREDVPESLYKSARSILTRNTNIYDEKEKNISTILDNILYEKQINRERVHFLRNLIHRFPYNPIWYNELSLTYVRLGLMKKADAVMKIAVHLAPESRYISRSAARLFLHINDVERAHWVLVNNPSITKDPWIMASEIGVNALRGRSSRFIKIGVSMINSGNYSPFSLTELASAIGTTELKTSRKKCKLYIDKALIQPNDNSLSQAEWLLSIDDSLHFNFLDYSSIKNKFEADARFAFIHGDYQKALNTSVSWINEMPFAKTPIFFAAEMAYTYQKDYNNAIKILKIGLESNPNELSFLNNLAYAYALNGETNETDKILNSPLLSNSTNMNHELKVCLTATKGLNEYRKGNIDVGRRCYKEAIDIASMNKLDKNILHKALLNFIREEVRATKTCDAKLLDSIEYLHTGNDRETLIMRQDIKNML